MPAGDTAFGDRSAPFMLSVDGNTYDGSKLRGHQGMGERFIEAAQQLDGAAGGAYLNFSGDDATEETVVQAQYGGNLPRLAAVKRTYDPDKLFRVNNNIRPAWPHRWAAMLGRRGQRAPVPAGAAENGGHLMIERMRPVAPRARPRR